MAETVSSKPWSDFSPGDYTDDQWLKACLLDRGAGSGSAKQRASLPVREPDGTLNKNACHAAAAALAGARGGVKASPELLASAKKKLAALYMSALGADVPDSLKHDNVTFEEILATHGEVTLEHARAKEDQNKGPDAAWLMKENIANLKQRAANMALKPGIVAEVTMLAAKYKVPKNHLAQSGAAMEELTQWYIAHLNATLAQIGISPSRIYRLVAKRGSGYNIYASIEGGDASKRFSLPEEPVLTHENFEEGLEHARAKEDQKHGPDIAWLMKENIANLKQRANKEALFWLVGEVPRLVKKYKLPDKDAIMNNPAALNELVNGYVTRMNANLAQKAVSPTGIYRLVAKRGSGSNVFVAIEGGDASKRYSLPEEPVLTHDDELTEFLEHHGIKGQKWGIRRSDSELGAVARLKNKFSRKKGEGDDAEEPKGKASGGDSKPEGGGPKSGGGSDHVAVDHERLVESLNKSVEQMSTQELTQATNRANALQNYQRIFNPENNAKSPLEQHVAQLNLEKQRRDLEAQLNPPQKSALSRLAQRSQQGFTAYQAIDKAVGGDLSKALSRKLGINPPPNELDQAKLRTEIARSHKAEAEARAAIANSAKKVQADDIIRVEQHVLKSHILEGDLASQAVGYTGAGRRRAVGNFVDGKFVPSEGARVFRPPAAQSKVPTIDDLKASLSSAPAAPSHRKDNPLDSFLLNLGSPKSSSKKIPTSFPKPGKHR